MKYKEKKKRGHLHAPTSYIAPSVKEVKVNTQNFLGGSLDSDSLDNNTLDGAMWEE
ncbi:hypothetical protein [Bacteroides heparinolyticus]|uniref:hypothetical protein n=1 Tax=Prevotella heparinolytica TaxID=28113 RepID=UPI0035A0156D